MSDCMKGLSREDPNYRREHVWTVARFQARVRDGYTCVNCGSRENLEVNHIEPRRGEGYADGCAHHSENLETLCQTCHSAVTRKQMGQAPSVPVGLRIDNRKRANVHAWRHPKTDLYVVRVEEDGRVILTPAVVITDPEVVNGS